jgi:Domain of unknown function (DUF6748)
MKNLIRFTARVRAISAATVLVSLALASGPSVELKQSNTDSVNTLDLIADSIDSTSTYYVVQRDRRRCASPLCGGYFVKRANQTLTHCADGVRRSRCYVPSIDWNGQPEVEPERAVLRGSVESKVFPKFGNLGTIRVTESWQAASDSRPSGVFYRVRDLGIRCITHPCLTHHAAKSNSTLDQNVAGVDLTRVGASEELVARALKEMTSTDGVLVAGLTASVKGPAGRAKTLKASQFYLRNTQQQSEKPRQKDPARGKGCMRSGCSNQVCSDEPVMTTCEWRPEYACYQKARCERQADGKCGFTQTPELTACLKNPPRP